MKNLEVIFFVFMASCLSNDQNNDSIIVNTGSVTSQVSSDQNKNEPIETTTNGKGYITINDDDRQCDTKNDCVNVKTTCVCGYDFAINKAHKSKYKDSLDKACVGHEWYSLTCIRHPDTDIECLKNKCENLLIDKPDECTSDSQCFPVSYNWCCGDKKSVSSWYFEILNRQAAKIKSEYLDCSETSCKQVDLNYSVCDMTDGTGTCTLGHREKLIIQEFIPQLTRIMGSCLEDDKYNCLIIELYKDDQAMAFHLYDKELFSKDEVDIASDIYANRYDSDDRKVLFFTDPILKIEKMVSQYEKLKNFLCYEGKITFKKRGRKFGDKIEGVAENLKCRQVKAQNYRDFLSTTFEIIIGKVKFGKAIGEHKYESSN